MKEEEDYEVLVVVKSNALINPDTMMVEFLNTDVTHWAMFGACRLVKGTGSTLDTLLKQEVIKFESLKRPLNLALICWLLQAAWVNNTSHEITDIAGDHNQRHAVGVKNSQSWIWNVLDQAFSEKDKKAPKSENEVADLNQGIRLIADVV